MTLPDSPKQRLVPQPLLRVAFRVFWVIVLLENPAIWIQNLDCWKEVTFKNFCVPFLCKVVLKYAERGASSSGDPTPHVKLRIVFWTGEQETNLVLLTTF